jgi:hypothetical protein
LSKSIRNMTAREVLQEVSKIETKIQKLDHIKEQDEITILRGKAYDLMFRFIGNLHPGTMTN